MDDNVLKQLYEPFELKARKGVGNQTFKYVPSDDIIDRMNKVFKGNWETHVVSAERFENDVIMHVRVSVKDPESGQMFSHEGFASQQIARYTSGQNQGQSIDIGNSYKSAMSKAIKTAVTKWGVALYLEEKDDNDSNLAGMPGNSPVMPSITNSSPAGPPIGTPNGAVNNNVGTKPGPPTGPLSVPNAQPVMPPMGPPVNVQPNNPQPPAQQQAQPAPVFTNGNVVNTNQGPPLESFVAEENENPGPSDVQKQAIKHIAELNNMDYNSLAKLALQTDAAPDIDSLDYKQARTIIQYGNNLTNAA